MEIATFLAVSIFNEGFQTILQIMFVIEITIGQNAKMFVDIRDNERLKHFERRASEEFSKAVLAHVNEEED